MAPLIVQIVVSAIARIFAPSKEAVRLGMTALFLFTGASHFWPLKHDMAAMIPPPVTGALWVIYLTGVLEIAGAVGILNRRMRTAAAWLLILLLVGMFPANIYAAVAGVKLGGSDPTPLVWRAPLQLLWIAAVYWSTLHPLGSRR